MGTDFYYGAILLVVLFIGFFAYRRYDRKKEAELRAWLWDNLAYGKEFQKMKRQERLEKEQNKKRKK